MVSLWAGQKFEFLNIGFVFFVLLPILQFGKDFQIHLTFFKVRGDNSNPNFCLL